MKTYALLAAMIVSLGSTAALADKQEQPKKFKFDSKNAYVVGRISGAGLVLLERINPADGKFFGVTGGAKKPSGEDDDARIGGRRGFVGSTGQTHYLTSLTPGDWVIMGSNRTCMCMGSYKFTVRAGEIVDLGEIRIDRENMFQDANGEQIKIPDDLGDRPYAVSDQMTVRAAMAEDKTKLPPALQGLPVVPASYEMGVEFANRRGLLVNRAFGLPPIVAPRDRATRAGGADPAATVQ